MSDTVTWQRIEGALVFAVALVIFLHMDDGLSWWVALALFFAPDISFAAYALGPRVGAAGYNLAHLYGLGTAVVALGLLQGSGVMVVAGLLWVAHSGFDRMLGYGLKSSRGFRHTHLGVIGRDPVA